MVAKGGRWSQGVVGGRKGWSVFGGLLSYLMPDSEGENTTSQV